MRFWILSEDTDFREDIHIEQGPDTGTVSDLIKALEENLYDYHPETFILKYHGKPLQLSRRPPNMSLSSFNWTEKEPILKYSINDKSLEKIKKTIKKKINDLGEEEEDDLFIQYAKNYRKWYSDRENEYSLYREQLWDALEKEAQNTILKQSSIPQTTLEPEQEEG